MNRLHRTIIGVGGILGLLLLSVATVSAQSPSPATAPAATASYQGEIEKTGAAPTVRVNGQDRPLVVAPGATVLRGNVAVRPDQLKKGDAVTVTTNPDGSASRIEAIPVKEESGFKWWYLLPLLLLLLIPLFMRRRKKDDFVVERNRDATTTTTTDRPGGGANRP